MYWLPGIKSKREREGRGRERGGRGEGEGWENRGYFSGEFRFEKEGSTFDE